MRIPEKIFVVGAKGSGKTEFANALSMAFYVRNCAGWPGVFPVSECSSALIARLARLMVRLPDYHDEKFVDEWADQIRGYKNDYRPALLELGAQLAKDSPGLLLTEAAAGGRIVVGARRQAEVNGYYQAQRAAGGYGAAPWQRDAWVLVDRPGLLNCDFDDRFFRMQVCRHVVFNANGIEGLKQQAERLAEELCNG